MSFLSVTEENDVHLPLILIATIKSSSLLQNRKKKSVKEADLNETNTRYYGNSHASAGCEFCLYKGKC